MNQLTFVPASGQFFGWWQPGGGATAKDSPLLEALQRHGWPATALIIDPLGGGPPEPVEGVLLELLDVLPVLCGAAATELQEAPPAIAGWALSLRAHLELITTQVLAPQLAPRRGADGRVSGWEARWTLTGLSPAQRARLARLSGCLGIPQEAVIVPRGRRAPGALPAPHTARGVLLRVLDACADMLVREAARRGACVRLGGVPADAWEQRLVHALTNDDPTFALGGQDGRALAEELRAFVHDGAQGSPPSFRADESLQEAMARMTAPALQLAQRLLRGESAPRTLPRETAPRPLAQQRLQQAVAVTRSLIQLTARGDLDPAGPAGPLGLDRRRAPRDRHHEEAQISLPLYPTRWQRG